MTVNVIRNYVNKYDFAVDSVDALVNSRRLSSLGEVYVQSFYDGWQATTAGPKGGHFVYRTGATAGAPTVGSPVAPGTIGTGAQAGYYWDQDGIEWAISLDQDINAFMFGTTGLEADTGYSQNLADFFTFTLNRPGEYVVPPGTYMIEQAVGGTKTVTGWTTYICDGAVFKRLPTTSSYNMVTVGGRQVKFIGLGLFGYVASGTDHSNVIPTFSFGFRYDGSNPQENIIHERCYVDNIPYDGWLIGRNCENIQLIDCEGGQNEECYRNTVAIAPSGVGAYCDQIIIRGGKYAKARLRPAIDLEPDSAGMAGYVFIGGGLRCTGALDATPSNIEHLQIDGVIMDGVNAGVKLDGFKKLSIGDMVFLNGAGMKSPWGPPDQGASPNSLSERTESHIVLYGNIQGLGNDENKENLLDYSHNTTEFDTTPSISGPGTVTATWNTVVGPSRGVEIDADLRTWQVDRDYAVVVPDTIYTFGAFTKMISGANNAFYITLREYDAGNNILHSWVFEPQTEVRHHNLIFKTDPNTTYVRVRFGHASTSFTGVCRFGAFYLYRGILPTGWVPHYRERFGPLYAATPTNGAWEVSQTISIETPAAGSVGQVCTVAGTPGTWAAF